MNHFPSNLMSLIASNDSLDDAFTHVYRARREDHANSDIWGLSLTWSQQRDEIRNHLVNGSYQLEPVQNYDSHNGHALSRWTARDAVVLKAVANTLTPLFSSDLDTRCHHLKGNGGLKGALRAIRTAITTNGYHHVVKSDIANFYASMDHETLQSLCGEHIKDPRVLTLLNNYMNRVEVRYGDHQLIDIGVAKGCPLSPLMGAIMLKSLDKMIPPGCAYARYMDDWVILTRSRHQLRRLIKNMHDVVRGLKFKLALNKTFIGRIHSGFDFLGYRFGAKGLLGLAQQTLNNHLEKLRQLYEQGAPDQRVVEYKLNWRRWVASGL